MESAKEKTRRVRSLLWKWGSTLYYVRRKEDEIKALSAMINEAYNTLGASEISSMPKSKDVTSSVERAMEVVERRIGEYERSVGIIQASIVDAMRLKETIDELVDGLTPDAQKILCMRYIDNHQWSYIALRMNYEEGHVKRKEKDAIEKMLRNVTFDVLK